MCIYSPVCFSIYWFSTTEHFVLQVKLFYSYKLDNRLIFKGKEAEIADKGDEITEKTASQTHMHASMHSHSAYLLSFSCKLCKHNL